MSTNVENSEKINIGDTWYFEGQVKVTIVGFAYDYKNIGGHNPMIVLDRFLPYFRLEENEEYFPASPSFAQAESGQVRQVVTEEYFRDHFTREKKRWKKKKPLVCDCCGGRLELEVTDKRAYMVSEDGRHVDMPSFQIEEPSYEREYRLWCNFCGKEYPCKVERNWFGVEEIIKV